jgi:2-methylcitrate dehydratase PrpD
VVTVAVLDNQVGLASFSELRLRDPVLRALLARVQHTADPNIPTAFSEMWVEAPTDGNRSYRADSWPGHWDQPMAIDEFEAKFHACATEVLSVEAAH